MSLNFNDFLKLDIKFDVEKLQAAYKEVIKIKNFESPGEITNFGAISLTQIPGDPDSIKGHKARGVFWTKPNSSGNEVVRDVKIDAIIGVESRGFLFGFLLANRMKIPFIPIRKVGKLPGETLKYKYDLEYGSSEVEVHISDIKKDWNVLIHDDLLATGGTACAASELVEKLGAKVVAFAFIISLDFLDGNKRLEKYSKNIISLKRY